MAESARQSPGVVEQISSAGHVCLIYEDDEQRRRTVAEFIAAGLREGEAVRYFADATSPDTVRTWLEEAGIPIAAAEARGAFAIAPAVSAYCAGGSHDPQALIDGLASRYEAADRAGYTGSRSAGEMSWVMKGLPGSDRFVEYEAMLNRVYSPYRHCGMCQYDARIFDGATLFKVLQVHPFMVANGQIVQNPYYIRPGELLRNT
jgi:hypothetical protein